ncbi:hypothetical protein GOP47_0006266 [Adiantum capillus-veneris]|uniref:HTH TFE/IIEalpha-type domain-containing protein n=1 Tax=Adiantum capillus-veneris TaxID=13818 RepID=A0A9D4ZMV7_ADICA|nr:hypothetical protein GOP47_0006266 [Adiantum capillus-veneris]
MICCEKVRSARLVKLVARAFYDDDMNAKGANKPKTEKFDNRGIAVVVLDALTRRQWVKEDDLAKNLRLHPKQLRRTLRTLEEEALIVREHRRETAKGVKAYNAAIAATNDGSMNQREGEEKQKLHTHSYCCLDYAQVYDIVRYRIHRAKKKIKDELEDRNTVQHYLCPNSNCARRYSALDAMRLVSPLDENFHCENCNAELVAESDKLAAEELGDGEDNARRRRREKLKDLYERLEKQLKPLMDQLNKVKDLTPPDYGNLLAWEARAIAAGRLAPNGEAIANLPKASHAQGHSGTPMPFVGETKVEVSLAGAESKEEDTKENVAGGPMKVLPPWMIRDGMNLTAEQRGDVKPEVKSEDQKLADGLAATAASIDSKVLEDDKEAKQRKLQEEYAKAYYAALMQRQQDAMTGSLGNSDAIAASDCEVGMKSKREEDDEDVEWEEADTFDEGVSTQESGLGTNNPETHEQAGTNRQEDDGGDDDDIDWEDG